MRSHNNPWARVAAKISHAIPHVFIPLSDQAIQEHKQLTSIIGEILLGHGNPTKEEIISGLCAVSTSLQIHDWKLFGERDSYLAQFPSSAGLEVVCVVL